MSDSDSDEEILVYADFQDNITVEELAADPSNLSINFIGVDHEKPIVELNGKFFKGKTNAISKANNVNTKHFCSRNLRFLSWDTSVFRERRGSTTIGASL